MRCSPISQCCSPYQPCNIGVPLGTIMVPLLWNIFVNNFRPAINCVKYADDTTVYNIVHNGDVSVYNSTSHKAYLSFSHLGNPIQQTADYASTWCRHNSMLLNAAKLQLITFTLQKSVHSVPITVKDIITESKSSIKAVYSTNIEDGQNQIHSTSSSKMQNIAMQQEFFLQILLILISFFCTWSNLALQALIGENKLISIYLSISRWEIVLVIFEVLWLSLEESYWVCHCSVYQNCKS